VTSTGETWDYLWGWWEAGGYLVCPTLGTIQGRVQLGLAGCISFYQAPQSSTHQMLQGKGRKVTAKNTHRHTSHNWGQRLGAITIWIWGRGTVMVWMSKIQEHHFNGFIQFNKILCI
jgi:hypothetical protein